MVQLVERSPPTPEVHSSNRAMGKNSMFYQLYSKGKIEEKRCWEWLIFYKNYNFHVETIEPLSTL